MINTYKKVTIFILLLLATFVALLIYRVANASSTMYPDAPADAGTLTTNGGDCNRRTATWTHGGDYELYTLPVTAPVCFSLGGVPFEHPYYWYSTEWNYSLGVWIETYDNKIKYPVSHCYEMPGGAGWGGQPMVIRHLGSKLLFSKSVDNAAPGWRCWREWLPKIVK